MNTLQTRVRSELTNLNGPLSDETRAYLQSSTRNELHALVLDEFFRLADEAGFTKTDLARRTGKNKSSITRWLSSPSNLQIQTVSDLLAAMGARLRPQIFRFAEEPVRNDNFPTWLLCNEELPMHVTSFSDNHTPLPIDWVPADNTATSTG